MAFSRYRNTNVINDSKKYYSTSDFPDKNQIDKIATFKIRVSAFDRLDNLAFIHLGAGEYWWVIALMNDIDWAFGFDEGQILKIPVNLQEFLDLM